MKSISSRCVLWLSSACVCAALAHLFYVDSISIYVLVAFIFGIAIVVGTLSRYSQYGGTEDEHMRKIAAFSMMNSWASGISLMSTLLVLTYFSWGRTLSGIQVISLAIMLLLVTFYGWYVYYSFKGDVE